MRQRANLCGEKVGRTKGVNERGNTADPVVVQVVRGTAKRRWQAYGARLQRTRERKPGGAGEVRVDL